MAVYRAMLSASLVERRLAYSATLSVRVLFPVIRLVTATQSSAIVYARLVNATEMSMVLFVVLVWYPP